MGRGRTGSVARSTEARSRAALATGCDVVADAPACRGASLPVPCRLRPRLPGPSPTLDPRRVRHRDGRAAAVGTRRAGRRSRTGDRDRRHRLPVPRRVDRARAPTGRTSSARSTRSARSRAIGGTRRCSSTPTSGRPTRPTRRSAGSSPTSCSTRSRSGSRRTSPARSTRCSRSRSMCVADALKDAGLQVDKKADGKAFDRERCAVILGNWLGGEMSDQYAIRLAWPDVARKLVAVPPFCDLYDAERAVVPRADGARVQGRAADRRRRLDAGRARERHRRPDRERVRPRRARTSPSTRRARARWPRSGRGEVAPERRERPRRSPAAPTGR